jgi:hypothetical protein
MLKLLPCVPIFAFPGLNLASPDGVFPIGLGTQIGVGTHGYGLDGHIPQSKETGQAQSLISQYGLERAKHIVLFARGEAAKTNYQIQHFGAVLNYASRGNADFDAARHREERARQVAERQTQQLKQDEEDRARGEARLAALTPEQYQVRFEKAKAELLRQHPFLADRWKVGDGAKIQEEMIRSRIVRELQDEPMDQEPRD